MESTKNYDQFGLYDSNREIDQKHVLYLMKKISRKNLLHVNPIIVDGDMNVIEGQHRLEAAKRLDVPIWYVMGEGVNKSDMSDLNAGRKNWKILDYVNFWTVEKRHGYDVLSRFINKYPHVPISSLVALLSTSGRCERRELEEGNVNVANEREAGKVLEYLKAFRDFTDLAYTSYFIRAVLKIARVEGYDQDKMMRKISMQPRSLVKCVDTNQYIDLLEEIYNHHERTRLRFR
jgi:hypothetical protein